jgi:hypothetical protein
MKAARRRPQPAKWRYVPVGFYKNRPQLAAKLIAAGIGRVENVRFIAFDPHGVRVVTERPLFTTHNAAPIMNEAWMLPIEHIKPP